MMTHCLIMMIKIIKNNFDYSDDADNDNENHDMNSTDVHDNSSGHNGVKIAWTTTALTVSIKSLTTITLVMVRITAVTGKHDSGNNEKGWLFW